MKVWISHERGAEAMGTLPSGVELEFYGGGTDVPSDPATVEFWVPPFLARSVPHATLSAMTSLKVIQLPTAGADPWTSVVSDEVTLCNAKGVHTAATAEWVLGAMLTSLRRFDQFALAQQRREWDNTVTDSLEGKRVLIIGAGDIGVSIAKKVRAFDAEPVMVARRRRDGVHPVTNLPELLPAADIVVTIVPLTEETSGLVDARFLAKMPDGALLVNAARGPVVDTDALIAETRSGRLRAALDVTDPEPLPENNPLWTFENVIITPHVGGAVPQFFAKAYRLVGEQVRRFADGRELVNVVTRSGY